MKLLKGKKTIPSPAKVLGAYDSSSQSHSSLCSFNSEPYPRLKTFAQILTIVFKQPLIIPMCDMPV